MDAVQFIALASSVSLLAGWRLYLVTLVTGLAMKFGWTALPGQLHALDVLASNWILSIVAAATSIAAVTMLGRVSMKRG